MEDILKLVFFISLVLFSLNSNANSGRAFGLINTSKSFSDHGSASGIGARIDADMKGEGYGIGAEYKFNLPNKKFSIRAGIIYELERQVDQLTTFVSGYDDSNGDYVNGDVQSSKNDTPKIQMTTFYSNLHLEVIEKISLVGGIGYFNPKVSTKGSYSIDSGLGHQFGVDFKLDDNFFIQVLKRRIVLDSKGGIYRGTADLSNLSLLVGKEF
jgi:hypothetical protein